MEQTEVADFTRMEYVRTVRTNSTSNTNFRAKVRVKGGNKERNLRISLALLLHNTVRQHPRRLPFVQWEEAFKAVKQMHTASASPWASPVVLVKKKDGGTRFCVDYQKLNELTKKDSYPLPLVYTAFNAIAGSSWFSTLDLQSGYWQVEVEEKDCEKTAFTAGNGLWQFNVMAFGLCNAPVHHF